MKSFRRWSSGIVGWLVTIMLPPLLLVTSILLLMNPLFLNLEYRRPGFPPDEYGFTLTDRLKYSQVSVRYLLDGNDIGFLADQRLASGSSLFNERELSHMVDVKNVVQAALHWWLAGLAALTLLSLVALYSTWRRNYWLGVMRGGILTEGLIILILLYLAINFDSLFTQFHKLFFESGSWVFSYSDSLIRLFPLAFWQDCFIVTGSLSLLGGSLSWMIGRRRIQKLPALESS